MMSLLRTLEGMLIATWAALCLVHGPYKYSEGTILVLGLAIILQEGAVHLERFLDRKKKVYTLWKSEDDGLTWQLLQTSADRRVLAERKLACFQMAHGFETELVIMRGSFAPGAW